MYYIDEMFEYLLVNKCDKYFVGYLYIFINFEIVEIFYYYGMVKVNILLLYKVFNLVLLYWRIGKLIFLLCGMCVCLCVLVWRGYGESYFVYI